MKKSRRVTSFFPDLLPEPAHLVSDGVDGEGDEVEHQQHVGQPFVAVFEVVSVVIEFVEGFVFDFPSASCVINQLLDVVSRDRDGDDEMALAGFASVAMDLQCHPVDAHGLVAIPDWHVVEPLVGSSCLLSLRVSHMASQLFQFDALVVFVQGGKLGCLGDEDEVGAMRLDELRPQRHHAVVAWGHQRGRKYEVKILNLASAVASSSTAQLAMHLGQAMKLSAVQRDQVSIAQPAKRLQSAWLLPQHYQCRIKRAVERLRRNPVQALANVVVARNPNDSEQRCRTAVAIAALSHSPLMRQKRRLHEEHRKCRHGNVAEAILRVPAAARVRQLFNFAYLANVVIRLMECQRILKPSGSIHLHCDTTMSHYFKVAMDCIFKEDYFRNEIIWKYGKVSDANAKKFLQEHDTILYYSKSRSFQFNPQFASELFDRKKQLIEIGYNTKKNGGKATSL